jgi:hypothetical protein
MNKPPKADGSYEAADKLKANPPLDKAELISVNDPKCPPLMDIGQPPCPERWETVQNQD